MVPEGNVGVTHSVQLFILIRQDFAILSRIIYRTFKKLNPNLMYLERGIILG